MVGSGRLSDGVRAGRIYLSRARREDETLKVTSETIAPREVELTVVPEERAVEQAMRRAAREASRQQPIPGFRPGRAPYTLVERRLGRDNILLQALQNIGRDLYSRAIKESGLDPFETTQFSISSEDPVELKLRVPLKPVVNLGDYAALHVDPEPEVVVTDEQVDEQLASLQRSHAENEPVERPVQMGDQLVGAVKGVTTEGEDVVNDEHASINVTEDLEPAGFAEALLGLTVGETREFTLAYPEDYQVEDLAGKQVNFTVTPTAVRQINLPALDDEFAKTVGDYETLAELRESIAADLKARLTDEASEREAEAVVEALIAQSEILYPDAALEREVDSYIDQQMNRLQQMGIDLSTYLRIIGKTLLELRDELQEPAKHSLLHRLVLSEYAKAADIQISGEELSRELEKVEKTITDTYGERAEAVLQQFRRGQAMTAVMDDLVVRKALEDLTERVTGRKAAAGEGEGAAAKAAE